MTVAADAIVGAGSPQAGRGDALLRPSPAPAPCSLAGPVHRNALALRPMASYSAPIDTALSHLESTMFTTTAANVSSTRTSFAALALSVLVTVSILGGIQALATQPAADSLFASRGAATQVVSAPIASGQQANG